MEKKRQPKVSVIVPIYNVEKYIERCVRSLMEQTLDDIEYIFVNDATLDGSMEVLNRVINEYPERLPMVKIINNETNEGVSNTRQKGLENTIGEYIVFVDSDDWIEANMFEKMYGVAIINNADIVLTDFIIEYDNGSPSSILNQKPTKLTPHELIRDLILGKIHGSTCNKLYKKSTLTELNVSFPKDINYCEDVWFNCAFFLTDYLTITYVNKAYYHYFKHSCHSLSTTPNENKLNDYLSFSYYIIDNLDKQLDRDLILNVKNVAKSYAFFTKCSREKYYSIFPEEKCKFIGQLKCSKKHIIYKSGALLALYGFLYSGRLMIKAYEHIYLPVRRLF